MNIQKAGFRKIDEPEKTKKIERIARICYKSEDKIGPGSDIKMLNNLLKRKHMAMLEHADAIFEVRHDIYEYIKQLTDIWQGTNMVPDEIEHHRSYLQLTETQRPDGAIHHVISGNMRAWYEFVEFFYKNRMDKQTSFADVRNFLWACRYINLSIAGILNSFLGPYDYTEPDFIREVKPEELTTKERMVHERFTILFTCDRGVTHELVRMRESSFAQESTRYVNYANNKYGREIAVIEPFFFKKDSEAYKIWDDACRYAETSYMKLTDLGIPAQQARTVLPNSIKADIGMTANLNEWRHIFELRACNSTGAAHPQMKEIMVPLLKDIQNEHTYDFAFGDLVPASY